MMTPRRPDEKQEISSEEERIVIERNATFEEDKKKGESWSQARADILRTHKLKHPQPR